MKNFYKILGVIPTAEIIVIKAAYRALSQKYHPDKNRNEAEKYQKKMQELNEAYSVLSDEIKKKEYDQEFFKDELGNFEDDLFQDQDGQDVQFESDWNEITKYFPDLNDITYQLAKISSRLVSTFKYHLYETKDFDNRHQIAQFIETNYLQKYFGKNEVILNFAKILILYEFSIAAQKLNRAVNLLGSNSDPSRIIDRILNDMSKDELKRFDEVKQSNFEDTTLIMYKQKKFNKVKIQNESCLKFLDGRYGYEVEDSVRIYESLDSIEKSIINYKKYGMFLVNGLDCVIKREIIR
jgi:curved DNA-binding protein CbpA